MPSGHRFVLASLGHLLTAGRLGAAWWVYRLILDGRFSAAAIVLVAAMLSDLADGPLVRRFGTPTPFGAWFDIGADLALIVGAFAGFAVAGVLPWWPVAVIGASFIVFVATARCRLYDPFGRCIGAQLMLAALGVLVAPDLVGQLVLGAVACAAAGITLVVRLGSTWRLMAARAAPRPR